MTGANLTVVTSAKQLVALLAERRAEAERQARMSWGVTGEFVVVNDDVVSARTQTRLPRAS